MSDFVGNDMRELGAPTKPEAGTASRPARPFGPLWFSLILVAALASAATIWLTARKQPQSGSPSKPIPITSYPGSERTPSFSPDGNQVAFTWDEGKGEPHLYIKQIGRGEPLRIVSSSGAVYGPAWSRDGQQIAFVRRLEQSKLAAFVVPELGGVERKVAEFHPPYIAIQYSTSAVSRWLDWTPDSKHLVVTGADSADRRPGLFLVSVDTGERQWITSVKKRERADFSRAVSPDGRTLAYCRVTSLLTTELYVVPGSNDLPPLVEPRRLTVGGGLACFSPAWAPGGREVVAFEHRVTGINIWRQLRSGPNPIQPPVHLIESTAVESSAQYSPDGAHIVFQSFRSGNWEIWVCGGDGSHCVQLTSMGGPHTGSPRWSPDGKQIAFDSNTSGNFEIWVVDANGGPARRLTYNPAGAAAPSWSADGKAIYFMSSRSNALQIWKMPAVGGAALQVTKDGGSAGLEAPADRWSNRTAVPDDEDTRGSYDCADPQERRSWTEPVT